MVPPRSAPKWAAQLFGPLGIAAMFAETHARGYQSRRTTSDIMSTHGARGLCRSMWQVAMEIASAGGDRGFRSLLGPDEAPSATPVESLIVLETADGTKSIVRVEAHLKV